MMPPTAVADWHYVVFFLTGFFFLCLVLGAAFLVWDSRRARRRETALRMAALRAAVQHPEALVPQTRPAALVDAIAAMDAERGERRAS